MICGELLQRLGGRGAALRDAENFLGFLGGAVRRSSRRDPQFSSPRLKSFSALSQPLFCLFLCAATTLSAQGPAAVRDYQPGLTADHYVIHLTVPDSGRKVAVTTVVYVRRTRAVDSVRLDLESTMHVAKVVLNGHDVTFARDAHTLRVALPKFDPSCTPPIKPHNDGPDLCVTWMSIETTGEPTDGLIISQDPKGRWQYFTDHWPNRAHQWLPVIDHPSFKSAVEWRVIAPSALHVVGNGQFLEETPLANEPGHTMTAWRTTKPIPAYLFAIAVAPMGHVSLGPTACGLAEGGGCVNQDVYEAPELAPATPPGFLYAPRIVEWLSKTIAPFPYEKLSHLESSTRFGGMENASAIFYADRAFRQMTLNDALVAHETTHQWFGDAVTEGRWADLWLSEGFATYFAALWARQAHGDTAFRSAMAGIKRTVLNAAVVKERPVIDLAQTDLMALLNANSYQKGGFVLHMLRQLVGDSVWIHGIRRYYGAHKGANAITDDLRAAMEAEAKTDLKWFFDQWLTRPGYAELTVSWNYDEALTVRVSQGTRWPPYRLRLPVEVEDASGVVSRVYVDVQAMNESSLVLPGTYTARPRRVTFDPDGDLLAVIAVR
jgi:aminopeptidase N